MSALFEYSAHFPESLVQILEVANAEGGGHGVEGVVFVREVEAVFLVEADHVVQSQLLHLLSSYLHHALRDVGTDEFFGMQHLCG